jgi:deazaflavin-dependent oxidoreductase (nitroreductase family)
LISPVGRQRLLGIVVVVVAGVGGVALAWLVLLPRIFRRNRDLMLRLGPSKKFLTRYNDMTRKISGTQRSSWGLLTHVGRRSGHTYQTSLGAHAYGDGFLLPLGYGTQTDWYRNLMAAGTGTLAWKGRTYRLERPELISEPEAMRAWPMRDRILLKLAGMRDFVWLHSGKDEAALLPAYDTRLDDPLTQEPMPKPPCAFPARPFDQASANPHGWLNARPIQRRAPSGGLGPLAAGGGPMALNSAPGCQ